MRLPSRIATRNLNDRSGQSVLPLGSPLRWPVAAYPLCTVGASKSLSKVCKTAQKSTGLNESARPDVFKLHPLSAAGRRRESKTAFQGNSANGSFCSFLSFEWRGSPIATSIAIPIPTSKRTRERGYSKPCFAGQAKAMPSRPGRLLNMATNSDAAAQRARHVLHSIWFTSPFA